MELWCVSYSWTRGFTWLRWKRLGHMATFWKVHRTEQGGASRNSVWGGSVGSPRRRPLWSHPFGIYKGMNPMPPTLSKVTEAWRDRAVCLGDLHSKVSLTEQNEFLSLSTLDGLARNVDVSPSRPSESESGSEPLRIFCNMLPNWQFYTAEPREPQRWESSKLAIQKFQKLIWKYSAYGQQILDDPDCHSWLGLIVKPNTKQKQSAATVRHKARQRTPNRGTWRAGPCCVEKSSSHLFV